MRRRLCLLVPLIIAAALSARASVAEAPELLDLLLEQHVQTAYLGPEHPDSRRTQREIRLLRSAGFTVTAAQAEQELVDLFRERQVMRATLGVAHPRMRANARKMEYITRLLRELEK